MAAAEGGLVVDSQLHVTVAGTTLLLLLRLLLLLLLQVKEMYNWPNVAQRTVAVYDKLAQASAAATPKTAAAAADRQPQQELLSRLRRYRAIGAWAGLIFCCIVMWLHWFWCLLEWQQPAAQVDMAVDWPSIQEMLRGEGGGNQRIRNQGQRGVRTEEEEEEQEADKAGPAGEDTPAPAAGQPAEMSGGV